MDAMEEIAKVVAELAEERIKQIAPGRVGDQSAESAASASLELSREERVIMSIYQGFNRHDTE